MKISLIIPMYNERAIIDEAISVFGGYMEKRFSDWELIFVNDGSADGCEEPVKAVENERIKLISYAPNRGKGYAVRTGMLASSGDIAVFTDCDNAYGTEVIGKIYDMFEKCDADIIVGSRNLDPTGYACFKDLYKAYKYYSGIFKIRTFRFSVRLQGLPRSRGKEDLCELRGGPLCF